MSLHRPQKKRMPLLPLILKYHKAKNAMKALAIMSIFNAEVGKLHQKISGIVK